MCIFKKIANVFSYGLDYTDSTIINNDYYNGSDNDLENIFLEIIKLSDRPINMFNRESYSERLKFLANEGLYILDLKNIDAGSFKFNNEEIEQILAKTPKAKSKKKVIKKTTK
jgi:hypothetical protein